MNAPTPDSSARAQRRASSAIRLAAGVLRHLAAAVMLAVLLGGLPWALIALIGWPLPDHLPTSADVQAVLLAPMTTTFLLNVLACGCWVLWGLFTATVACSALDIVRHARMPDPRTSGPIRRTAAVLVGTVLISILGQRAGLAAGNHTTSGPMTGNRVVATAPANPSAEAGTNTHTTSHRARPTTGPSAALTGRSVTVLAPDPETGVHDSLWRIAERTLGDGTRWPEIFALNKDKPQPGGRTLTRPSLIYPGETLLLPADATKPTTSPRHVPRSAADTPDRPPSTSNAPTPPPSSPRPSSPSAPPPANTGEAPEPTETLDAPTSAQTRPETAGATGDPGIRWGEELYVGLSLAAAVSAALVLARRRQRRRYRPGSGDRSDLAVPPVVYQLRVAHLHARRADGAAGQAEEPNLAPAPGATMVLGVRDGRQIALDLAAAHGLGLIGAGADAAARALVVSALATTPHRARQTAQVVVPAADLATLHGQNMTPEQLPAGLHVAADLNAALDTLEAEIMVRAGSPQSRPRDGWPPLLLVARTPDRQRQRLQAILDNGTTVGVTGLLLGQWPSGTTAYVRDNGTISTANPGIGERLRGTRVYRLGSDDTADLLTLLHSAGLEPHDDTDTVPSFGEPEPRASQPDVDAADGGLEIVENAPAGNGPTPFPPTDRPVDPTQIAKTTRTTGHDLTAGHAAVTAGHHIRKSDKPSTPAPLRISVLGAPRVWWRAAPTPPDTRATEPAEREITAAFQPRVRELLTFLAVHPDGASREALIAALWATSPPEKTTNAMNTSLSRLRRALTAATEGALSDIVLVGEGRYRLDPGLVEVDYWSFAAAVAARRAATSDRDRVEAYRRIVDSYRGPLADGMSTEWIETAREAIRRDAIDAVAALARALVEHDPQQTLDLLEIARAFDPHNELIYRDIMRLQERLGQLDAIPRTLALLTTRLAEVDDRPTPQAISLAERLRRRHDADPPQPLGADRGHSKAG
ncbi:transcriptional regulator [Actinophytocola sp. NPDC049390]|uniref:transcriptional regulator n=1 Tax=Actinophytocola sp. NPDC049390 TaxID=3363894 RepID=UPI0037A56B70